MSIALPVDQTRDDTLLGASEAAAVLGLDKYRSPMSVWLAKRAARAGEPPASEDKPDFVQEAAEWGDALEPVIRGKYALATGSGVYVPKKSFTKEEWLRCTPDGLVIENVERGGYTDEWPHDEPFSNAAGLLQVKTCSAYKADEWADGAPPAYEVQCRVEMAVCDLPWCDLVCLIGGQRYVGPFRIHRDLAIEANILRDLKAFWQHVLDGTPPPVDGSEAWATYASSRMSYTKVTIPADDECRAYFVELRMARADRERAERQEAELKNQLLLRMGAAGATVIDGGELGKVSAFPNPARMDWKGYAQDLEGKVMRASITSMPDTNAGFFRATFLGFAPDGWDTERDKHKRPSSGWQLRTPREWKEGE